MADATPVSWRRFEISGWRRGNSMVNKEQVRWDARYLEQMTQHRDPSPFMVALDDILPWRGKAIDVAGGSGAEGPRELRSRGLTVAGGAATLKPSLARGGQAELVTTAPPRVRCAGGVFSCAGPFLGDRPIRGLAVHPESHSSGWLWSSLRIVTLTGADPARMTPVRIAN